MKEPLFLTLAEVVVIHQDEIERHGGIHGVRDMGLLESALAQPEASFGGEWLHRDLHEMAGAYAFHLCQNHPFFDGNKRTALAAALVFLKINDVPLVDPKGLLKEAMFRMAAGDIAKESFTQLLRKLPKVA